MSKRGNFQAFFVNGMENDKRTFYANYSLNQRNAVKTMKSDMNSCYVGVIYELFPRTELIINRFHLVQLVNRAVNITRIQVMNRLKKSNGEVM